jgi:hypothetical protein
MSDLRAFETETGVVLLEPATTVLKPSVLHKLLGPKVTLFFETLGFDLTGAKVSFKGDILTVDYEVKVPVEVIEAMRDPYDLDNGVTPFAKKRKKVTRKSRSRRQK